MAVDNIEATPDDGDAFSVSTESQVTDDPALKDHSSSAKSSAGDSSASDSEEASKFVTKESRHVLFLRMMVLLVLFAASAAISLVVYFVTSAGEQDTFESQYYAAANKVTGTCAMCPAIYSVTQRWIGTLCRILILNYSLILVLNESHHTIPDAFVHIVDQVSVG